MTINEIISRKKKHIEICQNYDVEMDLYNGFEDVYLIPRAISDFGWDDINSSVNFLGSNFDFPLMISAMTGGCRMSIDLNQNLALIANKFNIPITVGSQRVLLENTKFLDSFRLKNYSDVFLIANIGIFEITKKNGLDICKKLIDMIEADAISIHVNILQEIMQGTHIESLKYFFKKLNYIACNIHIPIIIKEVGCGIDIQTAKNLVDSGIKIIDIAGGGGSSWAFIESLKSDNYKIKRAGEIFKNWSIPTAYLLAALKSKIKCCDFISSGGIRDGLMIAKSIAMGASMAGIALPIIKNKNIFENMVKLFDSYIFELKTAMICSGSKSLACLKNAVTFEKPYKSYIKSF